MKKTPWASYSPGIKWFFQEVKDWGWKVALNNLSIHLFKKLINARRVTIYYNKKGSYAKSR